MQHHRGRQIGNTYPQISQINADYVLKNTLKRF